MTMAVMQDNNIEHFSTYDPVQVRQDFPCLQQQVNGRPLVFLDSAASAQKPNVVIDTMREVYETSYANVHRGLYHLSEVATRRFEEARGKVANFLNASEKEIIFTKGATEGINLVAQSYGGSALREGDEILLSAMEHHANIVPWQQVAKATGAVIRVAPVTDAGELDFAAYEGLLSQRTKIVAMTQMSNALGTITPMKQIIAKAHAVGAKVLVDACQSVVHLPIDVQALDADFLVFSGHKLYGPNGIGVLYGKYDLLEQMPPYQTGGEMIDRVSFEGTTFREPPLRFEAGTPAIMEAIALGAAIDYVQQFDPAEVMAHEHRLLEQASELITSTGGFEIYGTAAQKGAVISFTHREAHASDIGNVLDQCGIAVRAGHHCAQPLMDRMGVSAMARVSFGMYNVEEDVQALAEGLQKVKKFFGG
jgi:cysteine desulfurase/selenocysteine lyase